MPEAVRTIFQICLFKSKPQDLPAANSLLGTTIFATLILFVVRNTQLMEGFSILSLSVTQIGLLGGALIVLLYLFSKRERWLQTATALYGCSAVVQLVALPFIIATGNSGVVTETLTLSKIAIIASSLWYFALIVFILKESLEISVAFSIVVTLVVEMSFAMILIKFFGEQIL